MASWSVDLIYWIYWLNSVAFITLVCKINVANIQAWSLLNTQGDVYTHNFKTHCDDDQVRHLTKG